MDVFYPYYLTYRCIDKGVCVNKLLSAQFLMAVSMTLGGIIMAFNGKLTGEYSTLWGVIITFYFKRDRQKEIKQ